MYSNASDEGAPLAYAASSYMRSLCEGDPDDKVCSLQCNHPGSC